MNFVLRGFVVLLACAAPSLAQGRAIQSPEGRGLAWVETLAGSAGVEDPSGSFVAVEVPEGVIVTAFHELGKGWIAAGHSRGQAGYELWLLQQSGDETLEIEPPKKTTDAFRFAPAPLVESGEFLGLAWLEGDGGENNSVMASRWIDGAFETPRVVSPWSGEAQLALSGAVLADGTAILVWTAVDAGDDDVFWSRSNLSEPGDWSPPAKLHAENAIQDITPRVAAIGGSALAAWGQFDGSDYRLRVARLVGGSWIETGFASARGAYRPTVFPSPGGVGFLYTAASPRSWNLIEVAENGRALRKAVTGRAAWEGRPLVSSGQAGSLSLRFANVSATDGVLAEQPESRSLDWVDLP